MAVKANAEAYREIPVINDRIYKKVTTNVDRDNDDDDDDDAGDALLSSRARREENLTKDLRPYIDDDDEHRDNIFPIDEKKQLRHKVPYRVVPRPGFRMPMARDLIGVRRIASRTVCERVRALNGFSHSPLSCSPFHFPLFPSFPSFSLSLFF